jgi:hypothetical protein
MHSKCFTSNLQELLKRICKNNIKIGPKEIRFKYVNWVHLDHNTEQVYQPSTPNRVSFHHVLLRTCQFFFFVHHESKITPTQLTRYL